MDAIYARQSVDKKDSLSIEGQIDLCRKFADGDALVFQDRGFSGKNTKRPAFTELIGAIEDGRVQKLFVYRLDRFSRSIADFSRLWELLEHHGVEFVSVTEHFDTSTPIGRAMLNIVLVFAQLERETTAERVKDNYIHRFQLGAWPGGPAPYGFDLIRITDGKRTVSSLSANEHAEVVRWMFEAYARPEASLRGVARELTARGIHGPKREVWDNVTLSRILRSPLYVRADEEVYWHYLTRGLEIVSPLEAFDGAHACNVIGRRDRSRNQYSAPDGQRLTVANHEGFIDTGLWLKVQEKLEGNSQLPRANAGKYSWLTGLMKCARCGYAVKINCIRPGDRCKLLCSGRSNLSSCDAVISVDLRELEDEIARRIQTMLDASPPGGICPRDDRTSAAILDLEARIDRLIDALAESSAVSAGYISKKIDRLNQEREALLEQAQNQPALPGLQFGSLAFAEKKLVAAQFIDRILLDGDTAEMLWKV